MTSINILFLSSDITKFLNLLTESTIIHMMDLQPLHGTLQLSISFSLVKWLHATTIDRAVPDGSIGSMVCSINITGIPVNMSDHNQR